LAAPATVRMTPTAALIAISFVFKHYLLKRLTTGT
jgi:hypothetical protein